MRKQLKSQPCESVDVTNASLTTYGVGLVKGNPRICFKCHKPIRKGEAWQKHVSAKDPELGRYAVIQHSWCAQPIPRFTGNSTPIRTRRGKSK